MKKMATNTTTKPQMRHDTAPNEEAPL
jgi:hypothetical protein